LGCTVIEMLSRDPPYYNLNLYTAMIKIVSESGPPPIPEDISEEAKDFLRLCFERDASKRATAIQLQVHPWL